MRLAWLSRGPQAERFRDRALPFPRALAVLIAGVLVSGGCDATRATGPEEGSKPETVGPPATPSAQVSGTLLGRAMIPPGEGSNSASANIQLPAAGENMAVIRITGGVSVSLTAPASCQAGLTGNWGPGGAPDGRNFRVFFEVVLPNGERIVQSGHKFGENPPEIAIGTNHFPGGVITRVWRNDVNGACWIIGKTDPVPLYQVVGGTQVLTVTTLGPATVSADRRYVETRSDTVTFTAGGSGGSITTAYWRFVAGDTLETPGASTGEWINPWCEGQTTCRWAPPVSGRMYVVGADIDRVHWSGTAAGPVVWVGRAAPPCAEPTASAARMSVASAGSVSGEEDACREQESKLVLTCNDIDAPATSEMELVRGENLDCWLHNENPSGPDPEDVSWVSVPDPGAAARTFPEGMSPPSKTGPNETSWGGTKVVSSTITVRAKLKGVEQPPISIHVRVKGREWGPLSVPPIPAPQKGSRILPRAVEIANVQRTEGAWGKSFIDLVATRREGTGPDSAWYYLSEVPTVEGIRIFVNPGLYPGDPFYEAQGGRGFCTKAKLDGFRQFVIDHENRHQQINTTFYTTGAGPKLLEQSVIYVAAPPARDTLVTLMTQNALAARDVLHAAWDAADEMKVDCRFNTNLR